MTGPAPTGCGVGKRARLAVEKGREDLAREALMQKHQAEQQIDRMEAEADVVNYRKRTRLEEQFMDLERSEQIEAELSNLRNKVRKQPASAGQP